MTKSLTSRLHLTPQTSSVSTSFQGHKQIVKDIPRREKFRFQNIQSKAKVGSLLESAKSVARAPTAFRSLRGLSSSLSAGLQNVASGSVTPSAPSDPDDSRASVSSQLTEVPATTDEIPSENVATVSDPSAGVEFNDPQTSSRESAETTTPNNSKGTTRPLQISNAVDLGNLQKHIDESDGALGTEQAIEETGEREDLPVVALQDAHQNLVGPEIIECSEPTMAPPNINPASSIAEEIPGSASNANAPLMEPGVTATQQISTDSAGVKAIIEQREQQLMKTMQENASLTDTVTSLKNQLEELEALRSKEKADAASKARGLSDRLAAVEQQLKVVSRVCSTCLCSNFGFTMKLSYL